MTTRKPAVGAGKPRACGGENLATTAAGRADPWAMGQLWDGNQMGEEAGTDSQGLEGQSQG